MSATPLKAVFLGTSSFAVPTFRALLAEHRVLAAVTQPDRPAGRGKRLARSPVARLADEHGIPVRQPPRLRRRAAAAGIAELAADCFVVADYGQILPASLLRAPRLGAVNVHASLLPELRGAAPAVWAVARGYERTGVSTMLMDAKLDTGPVLLQEAVDIEPGETAERLLARLAPIGAALLLRTLGDLADGTLRPAPQDDSRATLAPRVVRADAVLDWRRPAEELANRVRAFAPAVTALDGGRIRVHQAVPGGDAPPPGDFRNTGSARRPDLVVGCGDGTGLRLVEVQLPGSRRMSAADAVRGRLLPAGGSFLDKDAAVAALGWEAS